MFKNYLKIALRNLLKNKVYSFIVIIGFSIGLACVLLIALWVRDEFSYDTFHSKSHLVYKVDADARFNDRDREIGSQTNYTGPMLAKDLPEIENYLRLFRPFAASVVRHGKDKVFREGNLVFADRSFFDFFDFPLERGNRESALNDPLSVVISTGAAGKFFPGGDPLGKTLEIDGKPHRVTGVMDINFFKSHINFDFLLVLPEFGFKPREFQNLNLAYLTYVLLKEGTDTAFLEQKATERVKGYIKPVTDAIGLKEFQFDIILRPLEDIYLHSDTSLFNAFNSGSPTNIYIMLGVALIIILIVSFNYVNLTLARSFIRTKEIGLRKIVGANKSQIHRQMLGETFLQTLIAFGVAIAFAEIFSPLFNQVTGRQLSPMDLTILFLPVLILILVFVVILSGLYPAVFLSRIKPIELIRSKFFSGAPGTGSRKGIVIVQFALSIILVISTFIIANQISYMKSKSLGFEKTDRIVLNLENSEYEKNHSLLKTWLKRIPGIEAVSVSTTIPGKFSGQNPFNLKGDPARQFLWMYHVDHDFIPAYGIKLLKGRNFSEDITTDKKSAAIINQTAAKKLGIRDIAGAVIEDQSDKRIYNVIGVIRDFHNESLHGEIKPIIIRGIDPDRDADYLRPRYMTLAIKSGNVPGVMASIEKAYGGLIPDQLLEYFFMDDLYDSFYKEDARFNKIFLYSSTLAIFLSCLGLFGLTTFIIQRKTKEIGIRKTLGASVSGIVFLLSGEFLKWVLLANVIAWPAAYLVMNQWLRSYAYRTSIGIWPFMVSGLLALVVALLTIGYQSVSAANANPVNALKYE